MYEKNYDKLNRNSFNVALKNKQNETGPKLLIFGTQQKRQRFHCTTEVPTKLCIIRCNCGMFSAVIVICRVCIFLLIIWVFDISSYSRDFELFIILLFSSRFTGAIQAISPLPYR